VIVKREERSCGPGWNAGPGILLSAIWAVVFIMGSYAWMHGEYYDYGWYVPPLAALMFWRRWRELPDANNPPSGKWWILLAAMAPLWAVARVLTLADPGWRLPQWIVAALALLASHLLIGRMKSGNPTRALWPVAAFALTAVPLPSILENSLIHQLSGGVIRLTAGIMNFSGRPVQVWGDRMESLGEWVEVADGCSGIRSLQGFLMVALFFGEWFRLPRFERLLLLVVSLGCVWITNLLRALALVWLRFEHGKASFDRWHDSLGLLAFAAATGVVWWLSIRLEPACALPPARTLPGLPSAAGPSRWAGVALLVLIELGAWWWVHPRPGMQGPVLSLTYPLPGKTAHFDMAGFEKIRPALRCSSGWQAAVGEDLGARRIRAGWFAWDSTDSRSVLEAFQHTPEVCMGGIGWTLVSQGNPRTFRWADGSLDFDVTVFSAPSMVGRLYVFKSVWISEPGSSSLRGGIAGMGSTKALRSLQLAMAWNRFRPDHARVLMGVISGEDDEAAAWQRFRTEVLAGLHLKPANTAPQTL
jgi:exosortase